MDRAEAKDVFSGPIPSLHTPFTVDGDIDEPALRRHIDFLLESGARALVLTAGDSHYMCLSDEEIAQVTRVTCEHVSKRAVVVAADRLHSTRRSVTFAEFARDCGAATLMCLPPDWGGSTTPETLASHYAAVAEVLPVTLVTNLFQTRGHACGLDAVARTLDRSSGVVAIKEDVGGAFAQALCMAHHDRVAIYAGGTKQAHLSMWPFGVDGYLSTFMTFHPPVAWAYWHALRKQQTDKAADIVHRIDNAFWSHTEQYAGGFDAVLHAALEVRGIAGRWRRPPYYSLSDAELETLEQFLKTLDVPCPRFPDRAGNAPQAD